MLRKVLQKIVRGDKRGNIANQFRNVRTKKFIAMLGHNKAKALKILDIGGTDYFWDALKSTDIARWNIDLLNLNEMKIQKSNYTYLKGDARNLSSINTNQYDVIFSNSVIEHVGDYEDQKKFSSEIRRIAKPYFIQTPNYYFPFEPHFLFPGIQYLPIKIRAWMVRHLNLGWFDKVKDYSKSIEVAKSIRLLTKKEICELFPEATIEKEKYFGFTKSFMIHYGFDKML